MTAAYFAAVSLVRLRGLDRLEWRVLWPVIGVFAFTAIVSGAQFADPAILHDLERNRAALANGEIWRLVTPLFVQDGGGAGTIFNLTTLLLLGIPATFLIGSRDWLIAYLGSGIASEIAAYTIYHQGSAGNSIANFGVAALLSVLALRTPHRLTAILGGVAAISGFALLLAGNLHGGAFLIGAIIALFILRGELTSKKCRLGELAGAHPVRINGVQRGQLIVRRRRSNRS